MTSLDPTAIMLDLDPRVKHMSGVARHGDTPFDVPYISEITDNLWVGGCTTGLILPRHIEHVISLCPWEQYTVEHEVKSAMFVRMYDSDEEPDASEVYAIAHWVNACREHRPTLLHCQAGLNRSNLVAATALVIDRSRPKLYSPAEAIALLREKRSNPDGTSAVLCNPSFERWVMGLR